MSTDAFFAEVYDELRSLASAKMNWERDDHTLSATALVNEAYLRLSKDEDAAWDNRGHFFAAAAEAMRRVLIERARAKLSTKRSRVRERIDLSSIQEIEQDTDLLLDFEEALCVLEREDCDAASFVKLRVFAGMNNTDAGANLGLSQWSAYRMWDFIQAWFATFEEDL